MVVVCEQLPLARRRVRRNEARRWWRLVVGGFSAFCARTVSLLCTLEAAWPFRSLIGAFRVRWKAQRAPCVCAESYATQHS